MRNPDDQPTAKDGPKPPEEEGDTIQVKSLSALSNLQGVLTPPDLVLPNLTGDDSPPVSPPGKKYQIVAEIGKGGMGTVYKTFDADLRRWVAMKLVRGEAASSKDYLARFIEEAQVCGQLEHPNIPPVHELGVDPEGRVYFTMKLVKGRTLQEIARDLALGRPEVRREFTAIRLAQLLQQAAMGIHYANVRGVIHRDLKPENIMVGDYGEVLVMDWGLAKVCGESESQAHLFGEDSVVTLRVESGLHTMAGSVQGTPSYMAPEQARGEQNAIDPQSDVFGLGAVLYTLLCFQPPFRGRNLEEILQAARTGTAPPPSKVAPKRTEVPPDLEAICMKALSPRKEDRHADARGFQEDLQSYIEGTRDRERRRSQALSLVAEGRKQAASYAESEHKRRDLMAGAAKAAEAIAPHEPIEKKRPIWSIEDEAARMEVEAAQLFSQARGTLDAAIQTDPSCGEARKALADLYWDRFLEAEARRDPHDIALYRGLVEANDAGGYAARLKGDGTLELRTEPPGAEVVLHRYVEEDRVLVPRDPKPLGKTPVGPVGLPMGSYLAVIRREGYPETRYPIHIGRAEAHRGEVRLFSDPEIGASFIHVPEGEFIFGGDHEAFGALDRSRVRVPDFFIARFPLTMGEWCEFLNDLHLRGTDPTEHVPCQGDEVCVERGSDGLYRPSEVIVVGETRKRWPPGFEKSCPAFAISWGSAEAYCRWRSEKDGREYSLPTEEAWEKAARGVDGRFHAWGDRFDWTFLKGGLSRPEPAQPEPVGAFPRDESPYGARDMTGTIREWTSSWFDERAGLRTVRGGSWSLVGGRHFRCANRFGFSPAKGSSAIGFRLFSWKPGNR